MREDLVRQVPREDRGDWGKRNTEGGDAIQQLKEYFLFWKEGSQHK